MNTLRAELAKPRTNGVARVNLLRAPLARLHTHGEVR